MPVYNSQLYVAQAIESILGQTFGDFEFLILDDGSTDDSVRIVKNYMERDPRIRLTSRPNMGVSATLQQLVQQARGEFIARMDADDMAMPERFQRQVEYLRAHPECVVVGSRVWEVDSDGDPVAEYPTLANHEEIDAYHFRMEGPALVHPSIMMRRDAVLAVGNYRSFRIEDIDLYLRLAERGRLARTPEFLFKYRVHSANLSFSSDRHWSFVELREMIGEACRRRNLPVNLPSPNTAIFAPRNVSPIDVDRTYGWRSLLSGHGHTARKYARRVLARRPLSLESWRLMYCALRGR